MILKNFQDALKKNLVFLNFHSLAPLGISGQWQLGARSLSWSTLYGCVIQNEYLLQKEMFMKK